MDSVNKPMPSNKLLAERSVAMIKGLALGNAYGQKYAFHQGNLPENPLAALSYLPAWDGQIALAVCTLETTAIGLDLSAQTTLNQLVYRYYRALGKNDTNLDSQSLVIFSQLDPVNARQAQEKARAFAQRTRRANSAGLLCRTIPIVLAHLHSAQDLVKATQAVASLSHYDSGAEESAVLLNLLLREALLSLSVAEEEWRYRLDPFAALQHLYDFSGKPEKLSQEPGGLTGEPENLSQDPENLSQELGNTVGKAESLRKEPGNLAGLQRGLVWREQLNALRRGDISIGANNGQCVNAFLQVVEVILRHAQAPSAELFPICLQDLIRQGGHTNITGAILGAVLGAALGEKAFTRLKATNLHGWPGLDSEGLTDLTLAAIWAGLKGEKALQELLKQEIDLRQLLFEEE